MLKKQLFTILFAAHLAKVFAQQNIVLLIADDLGTDYLGIFEEGLDTARTPNLRSLLADGLRFDQTWSYPYCSQIRAAALTGRFPFRTGVGTVITSAANGQLDTAEISIGKLLHHPAAPIHYATANIGKWHLHTQSPEKRNFPAALGYDHYSGNFSGQIPDYFNWQKIVDGAAPVTVTNYATTEQVDDAIEWLEKLPAGQPFFLWQAFNAPHAPFHKPPDALHSVVGLTGTTQHINQNRPEYFKAMLEAMDTEIGRLLRWLDDKGLRDSTNIIFIGDNGGDSRICQFPAADRAKGTIYENGIHVPMLIAGPAVVAPKRTSAALTSTTDLFATIVELAGFKNWKNHIPAAKPVDAVSLLPILKNEKTAVREWVFTELFDPAGKPDDGKAIADLDYKLLRFDDGHEEFYKTSADRFEQNNLLTALPLAAEALAHYQFLCNELSQLLGSNACTPTVGTKPIFSEKTVILLSPNPAEDFLKIELSENKQPFFGEIFDAAGRRMLNFQILENERLDISALPRGIFLMKILTAEGVVFQSRFVKN